MSSDDTKYVNDSSASVFCNNVFMTLESNRATRMLWKTLKPLIRGKILYSPDNAGSTLIMSHVNKTFSAVEEWKHTLTKWMQRIGPQVHALLDMPEVRNLVQTENASDPTGPLQDYIDNLPDLEDYRALWTQINSQIDYAIKLLDCMEFDKLRGYPTEQEVVATGLGLLEENKFFAGVVFTNLDGETEATIPQYIEYKIRMNSDKVDSTKKIKDRVSRPGPRRRPTMDLKYMTHGFAYLQDLVDHAIMSVQAGRDVTTGVYMQQMPYPCYIKDRFVLAISRTFPMFMTLAWVYTVAMIIKSIVYEKETRLKETMRVMGLSNGVLWCSWFIDCLIIMTFTVFLLTCILVVSYTINNNK